MYRLLFFSLPLPFLAICLVMIAFDGIIGKVEPEKMDRQTLVRVIQLRDFRKLSPDLIERLTSRAEQEFGRHSPNKPVFELSSLEKKIHVYFQTHRSSRRSHSENNLTAMARTRYFQWMHEYQDSSADQKAVFMNNAVEDVRYWQTVYLDYVRSLELPEPTPVELYQDFLRMIDNFKADASPEEIVQIDSFAKKLSGALFAVEAQKTIMELFSPPKRKPGD
ncbi:MAG: hypothetical protein LBI05_03890 [Planctomycetaceae bacterium]|jgi:hypothetical protein|nr:hypothetical protein [Planctomycetaceae bacterium]